MNNTVYFFLGILSLFVSIYLGKKEIKRVQEERHYGSARLPVYILQFIGSGLFGGACFWALVGTFFTALSISNFLNS